MEIKIENYGDTGVGRVVVKLVDLTAFIIHFGPTDATETQWQALEIAKAAISKWEELYAPPTKKP